VFVVLSEHPAARYANAVIRRIGEQAAAAGVDLSSVLTSRDPGHTGLADPQDVTYVRACVVLWMAVRESWHTSGHCLPCVWCSPGAATRGHCAVRRGHGSSAVEVWRSFGRILARPAGLRQTAGPCWFEQAPFAVQCGHWTRRGDVGIPSEGELGLLTRPEHRAHFYLQRLVGSHVPTTFAVRQCAAHSQCPSYKGPVGIWIT
jgi:hypothetical protein